MSNDSSSTGIGLSGVLFVLFVALKLLGKIDWSWWLVTAPLWMPVCGILIAFGIMVVFTGASLRIRVIKDKR